MPAEALKTEKRRPASGSMLQKRTNIGQITNFIHSQSYQSTQSKYSNIKVGYKLLTQEGNKKKKGKLRVSHQQKPELSPRQTPLSSSTGETSVREAYSKPATTKTVAEKTLSGNRQLKAR